MAFPGDKDYQWLEETERLDSKRSQRPHVAGNYGISARSGVGILPAGVLRAAGTTLTRRELRNILPQVTGVVILPAAGILRAAGTVLTRRELRNIPPQVTGFGQPASAEEMSSTDKTILAGVDFVDRAGVAMKQAGADAAKHPLEAASLARDGETQPLIGDSAELARHKVAVVKSAGLTGAGGMVVNKAVEVGAQVLDTTTGDLLGNLWHDQHGPHGEPGGEARGLGSCGRGG